MHQGLEDRPISKRGLHLPRPSLVGSLSSSSRAGLYGEAGATARPLICARKGTIPTREYFVKAMREALTSVGYSCSLYAGPSLRIGAATVAAQQGIQDFLIKTLGRWERAAYLRYIRTPKEVLCSVAATMTRGRTGTREKKQTGETQGGTGQHV